MTQAIYQALQSSTCLGSCFWINPSGATSQHLSNSYAAVCHTGVVNGVQSSLQNLFQSLSYVAGLVFWSPQDFPTLMYASAGVVVVAAILYSVFVCCCRDKGTQL